LEFFSLFNRLATVGNFGNNAEVGLSGEDHAETSPNNRMVIGQKDCVHEFQRARFGRLCRR
jgi:hypothetical protein